MKISHEIARVQAAIWSFNQQISFNPNSDWNKAALANAQAELAQLQAAKAA